MSELPIPFNKPFLTGNEAKYIAQAHRLAQLAGDGYFTEKCHLWLEQYFNCPKALLTHSCTAALEMAALLAEVGQGDEVIMPSFTFVSTANAFVLRGATPVFIDIRKDTMNLDENLVEDAITPRTKAIVAVHYAGVGCEMKKLADLAEKHNILLIEDAAQALGAFYDDRPLGTLGHLATFSFHETKNIISGEGGALVINDERFIERAEILREKGTNRTKFRRAEIDKYSWVDIGSSFLPGEIIAAFLYAQLEQAESITKERLVLWNQYHEALDDLVNAGKLRRPIVPGNCKHNAHLYYILLNSSKIREGVLKKLQSTGINAVFHYVPLHSSPAGEKYCRVHGAMKNTETLSGRLIRLPLWIGLDSQQRILEGLESVL